VKPLLLTALFALSACADPKLTTTIAVGTDGVAVYPTLSGQIGGATVSVQSDYY
jgi:hypothetical protein